MGDTEDMISTVEFNELYDRYLELKSQLEALRESLDGWKQENSEFSKRIDDLIFQNGKLKKDRDQWERHFKVKDDLCTYLVTLNSDVENKLTKAIKALKATPCKSRFGTIFVHDDDCEKCLVLKELGKV